MTLVAKRVLVIHQQIQHSIAVKQALEQTGRFEVAPFSSPQPACDHLKVHPQDVVLADLTLPELPGVDLVLRLRAIQPDIAIIASPKHPTVLALVNDLALQGIVTLPCPARELIPLIEQAVAQMYDNLPDTEQAPPVEESETLLLSPSETEAEPSPPPIIPEFSNLDQVVSEMGGLQVPGQETIDLSDETPIVPEPAVSHPLDVVLQPADEIPPPAEDDTPVSQGSRSLAEQLAADEPAVPTLEESGTVRDLMLGVHDNELHQVMSILHGGGGRSVDDDTPVHQDTPSSIADDSADEPGSTPTHKAGDKTLPTLILESALDDTTPFEGFSLNEFLTDIEANLSPEEQAGYTLPSWIEESERYTREPDFLPPTLPEIDEEYIPETTRPSSFNPIEARPEALETEPLPTRRAPRQEAPPSLPEEELPKEAVEGEDQATEHEEALEADEWSLSALIEHERDEVKSLFEFAEEEAEPAEDVSGPVTEKMPPPTDLEAFVADVRQSQTVEPLAAEVPEAVASDEHETPYIAQLALSLTQISLELTAEATLLSQERDIIAYAGPLPRAEIEALWDTADYDLAPTDEPRIRFITLPSSGTDYMLYSRRTAGDFTLSMLFADKMPLRVIRKQSNRLAEALAAIPETPAPPSETVAPPAPAPVKPPAGRDLALPAIGPLTAFAYVWLLKDVNQVLPDSLAHAIKVGLTVYLTSKGWKVIDCQAQEDYVYLLVDAPSEPSPHEIIYDLMQQSATIASERDPLLDPETLWADSYLAVIPGRELTVEEIQQFINFARG